MEFCHAATKLADAMIGRFYDKTAGAFYDTAAPAAGTTPLGALAARRKPLQDSPTPAGNPTAASALLRLEALTGRKAYRDIAEETLATFLGNRGALRPLRGQLWPGAGKTAARSGTGRGGRIGARSRAPGGHGGGTLRREQDGHAGGALPARARRSAGRPRRDVAAGSEAGEQRGVHSRLPRPHVPRRRLPMPRNC